MTVDEARKLQPGDMLVIPDHGKLQIGQASSYGGRPPMRPVGLSSRTRGRPMVKLTRNDYRVGARVKLTKEAASSGMAAKAGATATVVRIDDWLRVEWDRNELSANQNDGGYGFDQFQLDDGPW